jgi:hypothetical protein
MKKQAKKQQAKTLTAADLATVVGGALTKGGTVEGGGRGSINGRPTEFPPVRAM